MHGDGDMLELNKVKIQQGAFTLSVDMQIEAGTRCAVIGPSGAGKSTLLMAMAGFLDIAQGTCANDGHDITTLAPAKRPFAILFQDGNLFPHMTIAQNVALALSPSLKVSTEQRARIEAALADVGLAGMGARKPEALSGGQQSRAALARVLLQSKPWLLLDEPFAALGPALKIEMLDLVADLCERTGAGLLIVSHAPSDARRICLETILVEGNMAHAPQETAKLLDDPPKALRDYLGQ